MKIRKNKLKQEKIRQVQYPRYREAVLNRVFLVFLFLSWIDFLEGELFEFEEEGLALLTLAENPIEVIYISEWLESCWDSYGFLRIMHQEKMENLGSPEKELEEIMLDNNHFPLSLKKQLDSFGEII